jgi:hypothetical protein
MPASSLLCHNIQTFTTQGPVDKCEHRRLPTWNPPTATPLMPPPPSRLPRSKHTHYATRAHQPDGDQQKGVALLGAMCCMPCTPPHPAHCPSVLEPVVKC